MRKKATTICGFIILGVTVILLLLAALTYLPITRSQDYSMNGYIMTPDGQILEEFTFDIYCKEYDFIIDPPGGLVSFSGDKLTKLESDALILRFDWGSSSVAEKCMSGHFVDTHRLADPQMIGELGYYDPTSNESHWDTAVFDSERESFCIYSDVLADNAFIIGVSDPDTDLIAVIDDYLDHVHIPDLESSSKK